MKKSVKVRMLCLIVASVVLCSAVTIAALTGSPYEILKYAMLDAITYRNATVETQMILTVNGIQVENEKSYYVSGDKNYLQYDFDRNGNEIGYSYYGEGLSVYRAGYESPDGTQWYCGNFRQIKTPIGAARGGLAMISPEDRNSSQMRFIELLADVLVGDLKNNITMDSVGGVRYIRGTLTGSQVPELYKAALELVAEQSGGYFDRRDVSFNGSEYIYEEIRIDRDMKTVTTWKQNLRAMTPEEKKLWEDGTYYEKRNSYMWGATHRDDEIYINTSAPEFVKELEAPAVRADFVYSEPLDIPMKSLAIDYVHGEAEVDDNGNLLRVSVDGAFTVTDIFDNRNQIEVKADVHISDIGTSNPACPIPGAEELLTEEYLKARFWSGSVNVYFTLNEDGSINESSITTAYPGETDKKESSIEESGVEESGIEESGINESGIDESGIDESGGSVY